MASPYTSFLIRCWTLDDQLRRVQVEHVQSGERVQVSSLAAALAWLSQRWTAETATPVEPEEGGDTAAAAWRPLAEILKRGTATIGAEAVAIRARYRARFVDAGVAGERAVAARGEDGRSSDGHVRGDPAEGRRIPAGELHALLSPEQVVGVFWDPRRAAGEHAPARRLFPEEVVLTLPYGDLLEVLEALPPDLYVFAPDLSWTIVFCHEWDAAGERIALRIP